VRLRFLVGLMRPPISSDEAHRIAFGFSPLDDPYFATRLRDGLGERGQTPRRSRTERQQRARQAADQVGLGTCRGERKARILLKADVADGGEGWSDSRIIKALDTSVSMVYRVRKQLAEDGFEAVLSRKQRATPAVARIFDGEKEAKLVALACSKPPKGRVRWTLRLLENKVVELGIVDRASDSTIGRALKKTSSSPIADSAGLSRRRRTARS
jgi:transposase